ncbi:MAG: amidohydrolase [Peptostreptococcaceae bacterium]|nr:amidohydrolase [Peptostreptococcaceae bacterium]
MDIKKEILNLQEELIGLRRDFHEHPELGKQEYRTSGIIEEYLKSLGLEVRRCAGTGVIGVLKGLMPGRNVMLRCDIDALPVEEQTGLPFKSKNPGVMHACGHDGHAAMLMITAKILSRIKDTIKGNIVFLFQLNEEDAGAELMIADGAFDDPKPDAICGLHLWSPLKSGTIGIVSGPIMASSYYFKLTINGKGGHGGAPHKAVNPIDTAVHVLSAIKTLIALELDANKPTVISVCKIHGGSKEIIIPDSVELEGSIRCLHDDDELLRERFTELIEDVCRAYRCTCIVEFKCGNTILNNDKRLTAMAMDVAKEVVGEENIQTENVSVMLGDDFAEFSRRIPGIYYFVGVADESKNTNHEHHNPHFDIDEDALLVGVEMQVNLALKILNS